MMKLLGQLKDDLRNGQAVLFLGAGASVQAGLLNGTGLANLLYDKAGKLAELEPVKNDLPRLVAKLDKNQSFTRRWVNAQIIGYLTSELEHLKLDIHKSLFHADWKAIFTTNFDSCLETAEHIARDKRFRLLPIVNSHELAAITSTDTGKVKYFKIHGCCSELEQHPHSSPPLVLTQSDFRESIRRNVPFMDELKRYAYNCSIIFIGFQAHREENNHILASVIETYSIISSSFHQPFKAFVVLDKVNDTDKADIEEAGLTLLDGNFGEFIDAVLSLQDTPRRVPASDDIERKLWIRAAGQEIGISLAEYKQYMPQFTCYYDGYFDDQARSIRDIGVARIRDLWKAHPNDALLASGYYIERTGFGHMIQQLTTAIDDVARSRTNRFLVLWGKRACGKSTLARQLLAHAYSKLEQPVLVLTPDASYTTSSSDSGGTLTISGWDARPVDKFLSEFYENDTNERHPVVPVFLADHLVHRLGAVDHLITYLENHGKPSLILMTLNEDEHAELLSATPVERLLQLYEHDDILVRHKLDDKEIADLFDVVSRFDARIRDKQDILIDRAKSLDSCNRDILLILYTWFDTKFRRLEEIIAEQIETLSQQPVLRETYLATAVFHQYNISPSVSLCAEALGLGLEDFSSMRSAPTFKALIDIETVSPHEESELIATRHSEFSRRVLNTVLPDMDKQVDLMCRILSCCGFRQLQFARSVLNYLVRYSAILTVEQVTRLKEATEARLKQDYVLNHQFAAYLIRERTQLDTARYYLDLALTEYPSNSSIIHTLGNLCYNLFKTNLESDPPRAMRYYTDAKSYFARSRALCANREEHGYFTDIDMTRNLASFLPDTDSRKALLMAEQHALTLEALRVIPFERQNLLRQSLGKEVHFRDLPQQQKDIVSQDVASGRASPLLLEYYASDLLSIPKAKSWCRLSDIVSVYWGTATTDPTTAIVLSVIAKKAFIKNAATRFELLRPYFDSLVRYQDAQVNFVLLAEYVRLLQVDALVLEKYNFLKSTIGDIVELFRDSKPRFLTDEFILHQKYYMFDEKATDTLISYFEDKIDFVSPIHAERFNRLVQLPADDRQRFFYIQMDPVEHFFIKGVRKETAMRGKAELSFLVRHTFEGFLAASFRT